MLNLDQKATNKLIIALGIAVFLFAICALSGWLVAFAAGYSHGAISKDLTEVQNELNSCERDLEEAEEVATNCLDGDDISYEDSSDEVCGNQVNGDTEFADDRLKVWFTVPGSVDCLDVSTYTYSDSQYLYFSADYTYFSMSIGDASTADYYDEESGYTLTSQDTVTTADGITLELNVYTYEYDEYSYYVIVAKTAEADRDIGFNLVTTTYSEEAIDSAVDTLVEIIESLTFNIARG